MPHERVHARTVRERLRGRIDPEVCQVLEALAEYQSVQRQQLLDMAMQLDQMMSILNDVVQVGANMKSVLNTMKKRDPDDVH